jgi:hypothetical protein
MPAIKDLRYYQRELLSIFNENSKLFKGVDIGKTACIHLNLIPSDYLLSHLKREPRIGDWFGF